MDIFWEAGGIFLFNLSKIIRNILRYFLKPLAFTMGNLPIFSKNFSRVNSKII